MAVWFLLQETVVLIIFCGISNCEQDLLENLNVTRNDSPELIDFVRSVLRQKNEFKRIREAAERMQESFSDVQLETADYLEEIPQNSFNLKRSVCRNRDNRAYINADRPVNDIYPYSQNEELNEAELQQNTANLYERVDKNRIRANFKNLKSRIRSKRERHRRGLDLNDYNSGNDYGSNNIKIMPRSEAGIQKVPGNKFSWSAADALRNGNNRGKSDHSLFDTPNKHEKIQLENNPFRQTVLPQGRSARTSRSINVDISDDEDIVENIKFKDLAPSVYLSIKNKKQHKLKHPLQVHSSATLKKHSIPLSDENMFIKTVHHQPKNQAFFGSYYSKYKTTKPSDIVVYNGKRPVNNKIRYKPIEENEEDIENINLSPVFPSLIKPKPKYQNVPTNSIQKHVNPLGDTGDDMPINLMQGPVKPVESQDDKPINSVEPKPVEDTADNSANNKINRLEDVDEPTSAIEQYKLSTQPFEMALPLSKVNELLNSNLDSNTPVTTFLFAATATGNIKPVINGLPDDKLKRNQVVLGNRLINNPSESKFGNHFQPKNNPKENSYNLNRMIDYHNALQPNNRFSFEKEKDAQVNKIKLSPIYNQKVLIQMPVDGQRYQSRRLKYIQEAPEKYDQESNSKYGNLDYQNGEYGNKIRVKRRLPNLFRTEDEYYSDELGNNYIQMLNKQRSEDDYEEEEDPVVLKKVGYDIKKNVKTTFNNKLNDCKSGDASYPIDVVSDNLTASTICMLDMKSKTKTTKAPEVSKTHRKGGTANNPKPATKSKGEKGKQGSTQENVQESNKNVSKHDYKELRQTGEGKCSCDKNASNQCKDCKNQSTPDKTLNNNDILKKGIIGQDYKNIQRSDSSTECNCNNKGFNNNNNNECNCNNQSTDKKKPNNKQLHEDDVIPDYGTLHFKNYQTNSDKENDHDLEDDKNPESKVSERSSLKERAEKHFKNNDSKNVNKQSKDINDQGDNKKVINNSLQHKKTENKQEHDKKAKQPEFDEDYEDQSLKKSDKTNSAIKKLKKSKKHNDTNKGSEMDQNKLKNKCSDGDCANKCDTKTTKDKEKLKEELNDDEEPSFKVSTDTSFQEVSIKHPRGEEEVHKINNPRKYNKNFKYSTEPSINDEISDDDEVANNKNGDSFNYRQGSKRFTSTTNHGLNQHDRKGTQKPKSFTKIYNNSPMVRAKNKMHADDMNNQMEAGVSQNCDTHAKQVHHENSNFYHHPIKTTKPHNNKLATPKSKIKDVLTHFHPKYNENEFHQSTRKPEIIEYPDMQIISNIKENEKQIPVQQKEDDEEESDEDDHSSPSLVKDFFKSKKLNPDINLKRYDTGKTQRLSKREDEDYQDESYAEFSLHSDKIRNDKLYSNIEAQDGSPNENGSSILFNFDKNESTKVNTVTEYLGILDEKYLAARNKNNLKNNINAVLNTVESFADIVENTSEEKRVNKRQSAFAKKLYNKRKRKAYRHRRRPRNSDIMDMPNRFYNPYLQWRRFRKKPRRSKKRQIQLLDVRKRPKKPFFSLLKHKRNSEYRRYAHPNDDNVRIYRKEELKQDSASKKPECKPKHMKQWVSAKKADDHKCPLGSEGCGGSRAMKEQHRVQSDLAQKDANQLEAALNGNMASQIVESVFQRVKSHPNINSRFSAGLQKSHDNTEMKDINLYRTNETQADVIHTEELLKNMMTVINTIILDQVARRTCQRLSPELKNYLQSITKANTTQEEREESSNGVAMPPAAAPVKSLKIEKSISPKQGDFLFSGQDDGIQLEKSEAEIKKKIKMIRELLAKYRSMPIRSKSKVRHIEEYLKNHLNLLQYMLKSAVKQPVMKDEPREEILPSHIPKKRKNYNKSQQRIFKKRISNKLKKKNELYEYNNNLETKRVNLPLKTKDDISSDLINKQLESIGLGPSKTYTPRFNLEKILDDTRKHLEESDNHGSFLGSTLSNKLYVPSVYKNKDNVVKTEQNKKRDVSESLNENDQAVSGQYKKLAQAADHLRKKKAIEERLGKLFGQTKKRSVRNENYDTIKSKNKESQDLLKIEFEKPVIYSLDG